MDLDGFKTHPSIYTPGSNTNEHGRVANYWDE